MIAVCTRVVLGRGIWVGITLQVQPAKCFDQMEGMHAKQELRTAPVFWA